MKASQAVTGLPSVGAQNAVSAAQGKFKYLTSLGGQVEVVTKTGPGFLR